MNRKTERDPVRRKIDSFIKGLQIKRSLIILAVAFGIIYIGANVVAVTIMRDAFKEYTVITEKEEADIKKHMGITIDDSFSAEKLTISHGGGDYCYQLWLSGVDDPEGFMESCFAGKYKITDEGILWDEDALEYEGKKTDSTEVIYECELPADSGFSRFDYYYAAFYKDGGEYSAKIFADKI